jgi:hypothetical protein
MPEAIPAATTTGGIALSSDRPSPAAAEVTPAATAGQDEWITRADAAALANCSQDSIRRDEHRHELPTKRNAAGAVTLRVSDLVSIGRIPPGALVVPAAAESAEVVRARSTITELKVQAAEAAAKLKAADAMVAALLSQLEQKDKQIASLTRVHEALVVRVSAGGVR